MVVCLAPAAPALLPRLTGTRVPELAPVRDAVRQAVAALAGLDRVVVVTQHAPGTLAGFGAPVTVPAPGGPAAPSWPRELADELLDELTDGLAEGLADGRPDGSPVERPDGAGAAPPPRREHLDDARAVTSALVAELEAAPDRVGLLLLADGSRTRGPRAPGGHDVRGDAVDAELLAALQQGRAPDVPDAPLVGATAGPAVALLALAPGAPTQVLHHDAPLGVGYLVALRRRDER